MNQVVRLRIAACAGLVLWGSQLPAQEGSIDAPPNPASIAGAPFSAVGTQQLARNFTDGNRLTRTVRVTHYYRDTAGRTRIEREVSQQSSGAQASLQKMFIEINDPTHAERYILDSQTKTAIVLKGRSASHLTQPPFAPPGITVRFGGLTIGPKEQGWSQPQPLGEQVIEGVRAVGTRREYTLAAGAIGNEKSIGITMEQWFSPDLGMIVSKTGHATTGGDWGYHLEHIVQGDPDPSLFAIPSDYTRQAAAN
jgi:hypothetical protein